MVPRPEISETPVVIFAAHSTGLLRITGSVVIPGEQRLSDYCNRLEGPLEVCRAQLQLFSGGRLLDEQQPERLQVSLGRVDAIGTAERRRGGDPNARAELATRPLSVVLPTVRVAGIVRVPEGTGPGAPMLPGRHMYAAFSPAVVRSLHLPEAEQETSFVMCMVNRARVVAALPGSDPAVRDPGNACTRRGCDEPVAARCAYKDASGNTCGTAWCGRHSHELEGHVFCDRHHQVEVALRASAGSLHELRRPALGDRTLSLVQQLFAELDPPVRALLMPKAQGLPGAQVSADGHVRPQFLEGKLVWERGWGVNLPQGYLVRIVLRVPIGEPPVVKVLVNRREIFSGVPQWIQDRLAGGAPAPGALQWFAHELLELIASAPMEL